MEVEDYKAESVSAPRKRTPSVKELTESAPEKEKLGCLRTRVLWWVNLKTSTLDKTKSPSLHTGV